MKNMDISEALSEALFKELIEKNEERNNMLREYKKLRERIYELHEQLKDNERFILDARTVGGDKVKVEKIPQYTDNRNGTIQVRDIVNNYVFEEFVITKEE